MNLTYIHRTYHQQQQTTFFSSAHRTFSRIDHKTSLKKFLKIEIIPSIFSYHNGMKLEISNRRKTGKFTNVGKLNNTLGLPWWRSG